MGPDGEPISQIDELKKSLKHKREEMVEIRRLEKEELLKNMRERRAQTQSPDPSPKKSRRF